MKKCVSLILVAAICLTFPVSSFAFYVDYSVEGSVETNDIYLTDNHRVIQSLDNYIGDLKYPLTLKNTGGFERATEGQTFAFGVYFLPDDESLLETKMTIKNLPEDGKEYCLIDGAVYLEDGSYFSYSPIFTWGETEFNQQKDQWETQPIVPGKEGLSLSLGTYVKTVLDDGNGKFLDAYRVEEGDELVFSSPQDPKGIPYVKYYELSDGESAYNFGVQMLALNPSIAEEILKTGGHYENGFYYPLLQYFPELEQMILDAYAKGYGQAKVPAITAAPTASTVLVNGKSVAFDAYKINDNNYFKLRDIAYILNGTAKQFEVGWNEEKNTISLTSEKAYTPSGGEMEGKGSAAKPASSTSSIIIKDGKEVSFTAYLIDGNNYFKLRDIGETFNFGVDWDGASNTILISTEKGYGEADPPAKVQHPSTIALREQMAREEAQKFVDSMYMDTLSDYSKASLIYEYLYNNVEIQLDQSDEAYKTNFGNEAYAALIMKKAACSGYCKAVMMLCEAAGLECKHINKGQWSHQWNMVLIDGEWIVLDAQGGIFGVTKHPLE